MSAASLNHELGVPGARWFEDREGGLVVARMASASGFASVSLQGAHVFDWRVTAEQKPVLWLSRDAKFVPGKAIRGGIPVCWPWFGPHSENKDLPAHGFARAALWEAVDSNVDSSGKVSLTLVLPQSAMPVEMWAHATAVELKITLGETLQLALTTCNVGAQPFVLGEALHTYFNISDIGSAVVGGLHGVTYWDTVGQVEKKQQSGPISFKQETDRVYIDSPQDCVIEDAVLKRRIRIEKGGSLSTVVWSPWTEKAERMGDLGKPDGWRGFVCVESANAWDNKMTLQPGEVHTLSVEYAVEDLR